MLDSIREQQLSYLLVLDIKVMVDHLCIDLNCLPCFLARLAILWPLRAIKISLYAILKDKISIKLWAQFEFALEIVLFFFNSSSPVSAISLIKESVAFVALLG